MQQEGDLRLTVMWRGKKFFLEMNPYATLKDLGCELQKQTNVKTDTMRLIVSSQKNAKMLYPFSDDHSHLSLEAASILEGMTIRMMGVPQSEVDEILQNSKIDLRIVGFDEEEKRMRQRVSTRQHLPQLPQGSYIFCDFRTLHVPGIELNPPAAEALRLMHRLAADPGIVAIMIKHRWRVGVMTEMAPVGYVGVSPKCILGFNKNHGEEISLRLRTDDLRGFRKYESIKKTLLHELAHMVHSEHDANFYALDRQLNEEAAALDWTKSRKYTLGGNESSYSDEGEFSVDNGASLSRKLGGQTSRISDARASSVAAAYHRLARSVGLTGGHVEELDPNVHQEYDYASSGGGKEFNVVNAENLEPVIHVQKLEGKYKENYNEPDPDDCRDCETMNLEHSAKSGGSEVTSEPDPDDCEMMVPYLGTDINKVTEHDNTDVSSEGGLFKGKDLSGELLDKDRSSRDTDFGGPNLDVITTVQNDIKCEPVVAIPNQDNSCLTNSVKVCNQEEVICKEPDPDDSSYIIMQTEACPYGVRKIEEDLVVQHAGEPKLGDQDLQRIQESVTIFCSRLQKATEMLRSEVNPSEFSRVLQTLLKIIQNVIEHPGEVKFKRLRKVNPVIQRNILKYKAAREILTSIGFSEDVIFDDIGNSEAYLVLKQNDPGRLWLAKSCLDEPTLQQGYT